MSSKRRYSVSQIMSDLGEPPSEDEAAAAIAAVYWLLAEEAVDRESLPQKPWGWRATAALLSQGLAPARPVLRPAWNTIERLRRVGRGGSGITGL